MVRLKIELLLNLLETPCG